MNQVDRCLARLTYLAGTRCLRGVGHLGIDAFD